MKEDANNIIGAREAFRVSHPKLKVIVIELERRRQQLVEHERRLIARFGLCKWCYKPMPASGSRGCMMAHAPDHLGPCCR